MQNLLATYKTDAAIATTSAVTIVGAAEVVPNSVPILQMHLATIGHYSISLGDIAALGGLAGLIFIALRALFRKIKGE